MKTFLITQRDCANVDEGEPTEYEGIDTRDALCTMMNIAGIEELDPHVAREDEPECLVIEYRDGSTVRVEEV